MSLRSFPSPGVVLWGNELGIHLGQLIDPQFGGINTWTSTPAIGPDGYPLSTDHKGFTGINLSTQSLEYWTGTDWVSISGGSDPIPTNYLMAFSNPQLDSNGVLFIPHNLGQANPHISIWDNTGEVTWPDSIKSNGPDELAVTLSSFTPLDNYWLAYVSL
jgi:hypothetical protein